MDDLRLPIIIAAAAFFLIVVWRVRPMVLSPTRRRSRAEFRTANARIDAATNDAERLSALLDAADAAALWDLGAGRAVGLFMRAFRLDPASSVSVERAIKALASRKPRACEALLWRRLGSYSWAAPNEAASRVALTGLRDLYGKKLRLQFRAKAIDNAMSLFKGDL